MESMRSAPCDAEAETVGFVAYLLGPDGDSTQMPVGFTELDRHLERSDANGLITYEDPTTVIAHLLQSGRPLNEALAQWVAVAQEHLALCRKRGRRIALCTATQDAKDVDLLAAQISRRFPEAKLPSLTTARSAPDTFFVALATLSAGRDGVTRDLIEELQARSIHTPTSPNNFSLDDPENSLTALLGRWSDAHKVFGNQIDDLNGQIAELEKTVNKVRKSLDETNEALGSAKRSLADKASALTSQDQLAAVLNHQVTELEAALKSRADEVARLKADRLLQLETKERKITELEGSLGQARKSLNEHEAALAENERLQSQLDEVYASTSWRITLPMRSIKRLLVRI